MSDKTLRLPAEQLFQEEIEALIAAETNPIPTGWKMSPQSVKTYVFTDCGDIFHPVGIGFVSAAINASISS